VSDDEEYVEEIRVVRRKKDTYRSNSSKSHEFESDLLRSKTTRSVAGPTESRQVDEEELRQRYQGDPRGNLTPGQRARADAFVEFGGVVMRELVVPIIRDIVAPAGRARLSALAAHRRSRAVERAESKAGPLRASVASREVVDELEPVLAPVAEALEVAEPSIPITRGDLLLAHLQLKLVEDYAAKQRWLLSHAEVTDEDLSPALEQSLTRMVEGRADELNEEEREVVTVFLQRAGDGAISKRALSDEPDSEEWCEL